MAPAMRTAKAPCELSISELNSMAFGLAVYASQDGLPPPPRKTRFRPLVRRYRTGFPPAGFQRKVSKLFPYISFPFPKLGLAQSHQLVDQPSFW